MEIRITQHARERMKEYDIDEGAVRNCLKDPSSIIPGHSGRQIAQKPVNGYVLRVIFEEQEDIKVVITTYRAERDRYEV